MNAFKARYSPSSDAFLVLCLLSRTLVLLALETEVDKDKAHSELRGATHLS